MLHFYLPSGLDISFYSQVKAIAVYQDWEGYMDLEGYMDPEGYMDLEGYMDPGVTICLMEFSGNSKLEWLYFQLFL